LPPVIPDPKQPVVIDPSKNELTAELEVANTDHHKSIVRARNENYE